MDGIRTFRPAGAQLAFPPVAGYSNHFPEMNLYFTCQIEMTCATALLLHKPLLGRLSSSEHVTPVILLLYKGLNQMERNKKCLFYLSPARLCSRSCLAAGNLVSWHPSAGEPVLGSTTSNYRPRTDNELRFWKHLLFLDAANDCSFLECCLSSMLHNGNYCEQDNFFVT